MKKRSLTMSCALLTFLLFFSIQLNAQNTILSPSTQEKYVNDLPDPAVIDATNGGNYNIFMSQKSQYLGLYHPVWGIPLQTDIWGYGTNPNNVTYPGPTFHAKENEQITVKWKNQLPYTHLLDVDMSLHMARPPSGIATVAHLHGGHTESDSDGLPEAWYTQNFQHKGPYWVKKKYKYHNDQEAATLWYHDHALGITRLNVYAGLAGFYLLRDDNEEDMIDNHIIPGGDYEREIVIQDRLFVLDGLKAQLYFPSEGEAGSGEECPVEPEGPVPNPSVVAEFFPPSQDLFMIVNGAAWPKLEVEPRKYRFRLLNGSDSRFYVLEFHDSPQGIGSGPSRVPENFLQIGTDDGFLENPVSINSLVIAPGERMDVVMDFTGMENQSIWLENFGPDEPYGGGIPFLDYTPADVSTTRHIMRFDVGNSINPNVPNASVDLSTELRQSPISNLGSPATTRKLVLFEGRDEYCRLRPMLGTLDDGSLMWDEPITENPSINDTEIWEVYNATADAHPIHLHLVSFQILDREYFTGADEVYYDENDIDPTGIPRKKLDVEDIELSGIKIPPPPNEQGWKDTGIVEPGQVMRVKAKFDRNGRYVWHCHILSHEDHEMMRPFHVGNIPNGLTQNPNGQGDLSESLTHGDLNDQDSDHNNGKFNIYPNPFTNAATITYNLPSKSDLSIQILNMDGKLVKTLTSGYHEAGDFSITWDGRDQSSSSLPNGIYTCMIRFNDTVKTMRIVKIQ